MKKLTPAMKTYLGRLLLPLIVLLMGVAIGYTHGKYGAAPDDLRCELRAAPTATAVAVSTPEPAATPACEKGQCDTVGWEMWRYAHPTATPGPQVCIEIRRVDGLVCTGTLTVMVEPATGRAWCTEKGADER